MAVTLTLYRNSSSPKVADKALSGAITYTADFKRPMAEERPVFLLSKPVDTEFLIGYNYLYVAEWNKYYFASITYMPGGMVQIDCVVDPLTTFRAGVRNLTCYVERQETYYDPYLVDEYLPISQGSIIKTYNGGTVGEANGIVYLTCVGAVPAEPEEGGEE